MSHRVKGIGEGEWGIKGEAVCGDKLTGLCIQGPE
jgi:hypothetical protein